MTVELKPCPFCGGEAAIGSFKHGSGVAVVCAGGCGLDTVGYWSDSHVSIAERWNRRATPDPLPDPRVKQQDAYNCEAVKALVSKEATTAREVFEDYGSKAKEAIDYMEQLLLSALRAIEEGGE